MDGNQTSPTPERQPTPQLGAERLSTDDLEAQKAPAAAENQANQPKADDGATTAQAQVAAISDDDDDQSEATTTVPASAPTPPLAADVDVIEPEWVKKAEEAVAKHRDDPRAEETAVEDLQREYLKARYNLDVKPGDEQP